MTEAATQYCIAPPAREVLLGAVSLPADLRVVVLRKFAQDHGFTALVDAFAQFIGLANSVVENNREMIEVILMVDGGMHPHSAEKANLPTLFGALMGLRLADGMDDEGMCGGCAFRIGTPANQSPITTCDADYCADPGEENFMCHEDLDDAGHPVKGCAGWAKLRARRKAEVAA